MTRMPRQVGYWKPLRKSSTLALDVRVLHGLGRPVDVHHHGPLEVRHGAGQKCGGRQVVILPEVTGSKPSLGTDASPATWQGRVVSLKVLIFQGIEPAT
jgi:hypothetical protein